MNILVVNPPNRPFTNRSILAEPIDVLSIATILKKQYPTVRVVDMDGKRMDNCLNDYLAEKENIVIFVYDYQIPLHTFEARENIFETIQNTKQETVFCIIGKTSDAFCETFLSRGIDIVIHGSEEYPLLEVIKTLDQGGDMKGISNISYRRGQEIIHGKRISRDSDFVRFPIPDRDFLDLSSYMDTRTMVTSRGCIGHCTYCTTPFYFGKWQGKSAEAVVDEIEQLVRKYGAHKIMFLDDNVTVSHARMREICDRLERLHLPVLLGGLSSISCYDADLFRKMYRVGFRWIHFGIESGSGEILKRMRKEMDLERVRHIIREVKETGYRVRTSFILDYPGTTSCELEKTKNLILELEPEEVRLHYLAYRAGTPLFKEFPDHPSQYIHNNRPNVIHSELERALEALLESLQENGYTLIREEIDWNQFQNIPRRGKLASLVPMKYGLGWYE